MSDFEFSFSKPSQTPAVRRNKNKLRVLVLGNFCGSEESIQPLQARSPTLLDIDNFESSLGKMNPSATIADEELSETISFSLLDDFSPDSLLAKVPSLSAMKAQRDDIKKGNFPTETKENPDSKNEVKTDKQTESADDTVNRLLGGQSGTPAAKRSSGLLDNFIKNIARSDPSAPTGDVSAHLAACDSAIGERMRTVLHAPSFASLESNWRSLYDLINTVEDDEGVDVAFMHATVDELTDDLCGEASQRSELVTKLVEEAAGSFGGEGWDLLVVCDTCSLKDANVIAALGAVSKAAGGKLLVSLSSSEFANEPPKGWDRLRSFEAADAIHMVTPLALIRPPYGSQYDAPDTFAFEECVAEPATEDLVWGSSAMVVASCLVQAHQAGGNRGNLSDQAAAQFRPQFTFEQDGVKAMQPVAETLLSDSQAENLRAQWGVMPLRAERNGNRLLFVKLQSLKGK